MLRNRILPWMRPRARRHPSQIIHQCGPNPFSNPSPIEALGRVGEASPDSLAEDALQKSWIKIFQATHACRGGPTACPWVYTIVTNAARDVHRKDPRRREIPLPEKDQREDPGRNPQAVAHEMQLLRLMRAMVDLLPETYRQVVKLRVYQDLSSRETAERLHLSPSNVDTRLSRAVELLTRLMDARLDVLQGRTPPDGASPAHP